MIMAGPVSMWGPNAQGVRSRPDRSVSLQPELLRAEQMRPQQMGGVFHWGGYGNPPALWQTGLDGRGVWGNASDLEGRRFLEAAAEQARREGKDVPPDPEAGSAEEGNWVTKIYDYLGRTPRYISLPDEGGITDDVPEPADSDAVEPVPDPVPEPLPEPDDGPWLFRGLQASSQRVNPQQEVFPGMGGWQEQLAEARQKLKEAERREAERTAARHVSRPTPKGPPIPRNQNPESGAASQFAPSGQLPVDPTAFRAPQGQTMDWFNNLSTEQKVGMALMLMSGGMAAGGGAAAAGGGAALRGGAALLPLILNQ